MALSLDVCLSFYTFALIGRRMKHSPLNDPFLVTARLCMMRPLPFFPATHRRKHAYLRHNSLDSALFTAVPAHTVHRIMLLFSRYQRGLSESIIDWVEYR